MAHFSLNIRSRMLDCPTDVALIVPDAPHLEYGQPKDFYRSGKEYKVLYLLHGSNGRPKDWLHQTNLARYIKHRDVIAVMPTALNCDYANYTTFSTGFGFWDYMTEELMPLIENWFPVSKDPKDHFIAGYSMGGSGALMFGLAYPELFGGIGVLSSGLRNTEFLRPYRDLRPYELREQAVDTQRFPGFSGEGLRPRDLNMIAKYDTVGAFLDSPENTWDRYLEAQKKGNLPPIYVGCGTKDFAFPRYQQFEALAKQLGDTNITFESFEGYVHDLAFWDLSIQRVLDVFSI